MRSEDEAKKKKLAASYHTVVEILVNISEKKTLLLSHLCRDVTSTNCKALHKRFESIDQVCRDAFENCRHPSSLKAVNEMADHLQDVIRTLLPASSTVHEPYYPSIAY